VGVFTAALLNIQNALAYITRDSRNYYKFGEGDSLPNGMVRSVNDSGTARACITKLTQFTQANGLVDGALGEERANAQQSFNSLISELSMIVAYFKCSTFRVLFDNDGAPARAYAVPTQTLRRVGSTKFIYNELMGEPHRVQSRDKHLQHYDPREPVQARLARVATQIEKYGEQFGDIVYHFRKGVGLYHDIYPVPDYYSGIEDIESDAGISRLELRNIQKGWRTPIIVSTGPIDNQVQDDHGRTELDKFNESMRKFAGEDAAYALHLYGADDKTKPTVTTIDIAEILDQTEKATERIGRKVCRHFGVPPILVGFATAGQLGNVQELENTLDLFKMTVIESQDLIKESLRYVFPAKNWDLSTLNLWTTEPEPTNEAQKI